MVAQKLKHRCIGADNPREPSPHFDHGERNEPELVHRALDVDALLVNRRRLGQLSPQAFDDYVPNIGQGLCSMELCFEYKCRFVRVLGGGLGVDGVDVVPAASSCIAAARSGGLARRRPGDDLAV